MTDDDGLQFHEADSEFVDYESDPVMLHKAIYGVECIECGSRVAEFVLEPDADNPRWTGECHECEMHYSITVETVTVDASEPL